MNKEYRLADGTFARTRPQHNTLWLDDMFMGVPPIAWYSCIAGDKQQAIERSCTSDISICETVCGFPRRNFSVMDGWKVCRIILLSIGDVPNGWALLTMCEVLDVLPEDYPQRDKILDLFRTHVRGLAACQSGEGFWHQLLDRNDSYLELQPRLFMYIALLMLSIKDGLTPLLTDRLLIWDGMP